MSVSHLIYFLLPSSSLFSFFAPLLTKEVPDFTLDAFLQDQSHVWRLIRETDQLSLIRL
jgi:hypothetical protein